MPKHNSIWEWLGWHGVYQHVSVERCSICAAWSRIGELIYVAKLRQYFCVECLNMLHTTIATETDDLLEVLQSEADQPYMQVEYTCTSYDSFTSCINAFMHQHGPMSECRIFVQGQFKVTTKSIRRQDHMLWHRTEWTQVLGLFERELAFSVVLPDHPHFHPVSQFNVLLQAYRR